MVRVLVGVKRVIDYAVKVFISCFYRSVLYKDQMILLENQLQCINFNGHLSMNHFEC